MSTKARLISTISAICLILALLVTGVWAVSTANVTLGGTISFKADNVHATVTGTITGTQETITLPDLEYKADTDTTSTAFQSNVEKWSNNEITFTSENLITMTITVTNLSTERSLYVKVTDNTTTSNITKTFTNTANVESGKEYELVAEGSITYTMTMKVDKLDLSAEATYAYDVDLRDANASTETTDPEEPALKQTYTLSEDETYYYIEMGTYNNNPVRWRYVSADGTTPYDIANGKPEESGQAWFIQETPTLARQFHSLTNAGDEDYANSDIRRYLGMHYYASALSISGTDSIYGKIVSRSMTDLYKKNAVNDGMSTVYFEDMETASTDSDKLWLPSLKEFYSLVGGQTAEEFENDVWPEEVQEKLNFNSSVYWTRSINSYSDNGYVQVIGEDGDWIASQSGKVNVENYIRAGFVLNWDAEVVETEIPEETELPGQLLGDNAKLSFTYHESKLIASVSGANTTATEITIPETVEYNGKTYTVTIIDSEAFCEFTNLEKVTLPDSIETIGTEAFYGCSSLKTINIPEGVTGAGLGSEGTFRGCASLVFVTLPSTVTYIPNSTFRDCTSLDSLTLLANEVVGLGTDTLTNVDPYIVIYVPADLVDDYEADSSWEGYTIEAIS